MCESQWVDCQIWRPTFDEKRLFRVCTLSALNDHGLSVFLLYQFFGFSLLITSMLTDWVGVSHFRLSRVTHRVGIRWKYQSNNCSYLYIITSEIRSLVIPLFIVMCLSRRRFFCLVTTVLQHAEEGQKKESKRTRFQTKISQEELTINFNTADLYWPLVF